MEPLKKRRAFRSPVSHLTRRWLRHAFLLILLALILLGGVFAVLLQVYYYHGMQNALENRAELYRRTLAITESGEAVPWSTRSRGLIAYFTDKDKMELQVLDAGGNILLSSTGFVPLAEPKRLDFSRAMDAQNGQGIWRGRNAAGESVMALTVLEKDDAGQVQGALRYVVSLTPVNRQIRTLSLLLLGLILLVLFFVLLSGSYFIRSIVRPVTEIGRTARRIAMGDYAARLEKRYDDEIGDLCDAINFMAQEIHDAENMKNEFISSVSHELRTPLTAIKGWSDTLLSMPQDRALADQGLAVIGKEADRLSGLVEELLDFSRMESGRITLRSQPVDLVAELDEVVFLFRDRATRAGLKLDYLRTDTLPPITGDSDRLKQVFVNLLDNAVKYSSPDGRIRVEAAALDGRVQVTVGDTGRGIPADQLPYVKQKFYQTDPGNPGSGIGLAMVDEIVRLHGGDWDIESEPGTGTTVTVSLPCQKPQKGL